MSLLTGFKKVIIISFSIGAGIIIIGGLIIGSIVWYNSKPKPQKPWNTQSIIAKYDNIDTEGENSTLVIGYTLDNNTDFDYQLNSDYGINITAKLERQDSYSLINKDLISIDYPVFIPARKRTRLLIHLKYPYDTKYGLNPGIKASIDERKRYRENVAKFAKEQLSNLNGFSMFDTNNRYEIIFPKGW